MLSARTPKCFSPYFRTISDSLAFCLTVPMWLSWQPETWRCYTIECRDLSMKGCFFFLKKRTCKLCSKVTHLNILYYVWYVRISFFQIQVEKMNLFFIILEANIPSEIFSWPSVPFAIKYMSWTLCRIITFDYVYLSKTKLSFFIFSQND